MPDELQSFKDFEHNGWERAAAHYSNALGALTTQAVEPLLDAARVTARTRVLDVATGPGDVAAAAARRGAHVLGIDFSQAMIATARTSYPELSFREGDAEALADADASYDAVVMGFGLLHLARPEAAIAEARRVLVPGGRYAFTVWARPEATVGFKILLDAVAAHGEAAAGFPDGPPFFRFSDADECRRALGAFVDIDVRTVPLVWRLDSPDQLFAAVLNGSVRTSALLRAQTSQAQTAIERAARDAVAQYANGASYDLPMPVVLASATTS